MALKQEKFFDVEYDFDVRLWRADGRELFERDEATQWEIGDWLLECDAHGKFTQREKTFACRHCCSSLIRPLLLFREECLHLGVA
jgi:hypothetical protein